MKLTMSLHPQESSKGLSLIEVMVSVVILGTAAMVYGSSFRAQVARNEAIQEIEQATILFLRQVDRIRRRNPKDASAPFNETNFAIPCSPYLNSDTGPADLDPPVQPDAILISANSFLIPAGHSWMLPLSPALTQEGYSLNVRAMRIKFSVEDRVIKYTIRVNNNRDGNNRNLLTADYLQEVR